MKKREIKKGVVFLLCVILILIYINIIFSFPSGEAADGSKEKWNTFYAMEEDTLDAVYLGTSSVDRYWISPQAWKETGMAVYPFAISSISSVFLQPMMEEVLKTQDVQLFIIDIRTFTNDADDITDTRMRRVTDNMKWSSTKLEALEEGFEYASYGSNDIDSDDLSWYIPFLKYHQRWNADLNLDDLISIYPTTDYGGYAAYQPKVFTSVPQKNPNMSTKKMDLEEESALELAELLEYCDTLDCQILFVDAPYVMTKEQREKSNTIASVIKDAGYPLLEFNTEEYYEKLDLDFSRDYYDKRHVNYLGAVKYTRVFSRYLEKNYNLEEYQNAEDPDYWSTAYDKLTDKIRESGQELLSASRK